MIYEQSDFEAILKAIPKNLDAEERPIFEERLEEYAKAFLQKTIDEKQKSPSNIEKDLNNIISKMKAARAVMNNSDDAILEICRITRTRRSTIFQALKSLELIEQRAERTLPIIQQQKKDPSDKAIHKSNNALQTLINDLAPFWWDITGERPGTSNYKGNIGGAFITFVLAFYDPLYRKFHRKYPRHVPKLTPRIISHYLTKSGVAQIKRRYV